MKDIESKLDELLVKKAPYQLPEGFKKGLVSALPWIAILGGVLTLLAFLGALQVIWAVSTLGTLAGLSGLVISNYGVLIWLSVLILVVECVLFFMAFGPLKARKKNGWNMLFWLSLITAGSAVVYLVFGLNIGQFLFSLVGALISLYLLFQVRSFYVGTEK